MPLSPAPPPLVLEACSTYQVLHFCMNHPATSKHLIICSSRNDFLRGLLHELYTPSADGGSEATDIDLSLLTPTLHNLQTSRNVTVAFCHDLANLLAYLSVLVHRPRVDGVPGPSQESGKAPPLLVIVNPIRIHEPTSSFSVQGFNNTFAAAVETAYHVGKQLVMVECASPDGGYERQVTEEGEGSGGRASASPWDQRLSMLNVTTKTFGVGERGWIGRTVKIRQVAERWCRFVELEHVMNETKAEGL